MAMTLFLQGRRVSRAEDMAAHFEISLRTVYRDVAALSEAGVPIVAEAGIGYSLMHGYHLPPVMFTPEEAGALATAGVLTRQMTDDSIDGSMQSALLKIRAVLPRRQQQHLERIEASTKLSESASQTYRVSILDLQSALAERQVVHLAYRTGGREEVTHRDVEPIGLVHYLAYWHLVAWCRLRNDVRDFRIDRIVDLNIGHDTFLPREGVTLQDVIEKDRSTATVQAVVHFEHQVADRARRERALGIIADQTDEKGVTLTMTTGSLDWLVGWLLSFQTSASVIEPPELRHKLLHATTRIQNKITGNDFSDSQK
jgi:predicted DNA-binding transcriptional regulator YafY